MPTRAASAAVSSTSSTADRNLTHQGVAILGRGPGPLRRRRSRHPTRGRRPPAAGASATAAGGSATATPPPATPPPAVRRVAAAAPAVAVAAPAVAAPTGTASVLGRVTARRARPPGAVALWGRGRCTKRASPRQSAETTTTDDPTNSAPMTPDSVPTAHDPAAGAGTDPTGAPAPDVDGAPTRPSPRRRRFAVVLVLLAVGGLVGALFLPTPYYVLQPGSVRPAEQRIDVDGARSYRTDGDVLFTTVLIDRATVGGLVRSALDDAVVVKDEEEVYGGQDRRSSQRVNQQRMDLSKLVATRAGLEFVGYPAAFTAEGARVLDVLPGSPSRGVLEPGDVITAVDGDAVGLPDDIAAALEDRSPGDVVEVVAERPERPATGPGTHASGRPGRSEEVTVEVALGAREEEPARPMLGVTVDPVNPSIESEVDVVIDSGKVTGPSAGLAWALAVVDRLTPGSLTGGRDVAVTGELLPDGTVAPVGGVVQKVSAVMRAGVELFLYPASTDEADQREMRRIAGDDLELRPVADLGEAVEVLRPGGVEPVGPGTPR